MSIADRLAHHATLGEAWSTAPSHHPCLTIWDPHGRDEYRTLTARDFLEIAGSVAAWYRQQGIGPRNPVVLVLPHGLTQMAAFVAALWVGAVPALLPYPTFKFDPEKYETGLAGVVRNLQATTVVIDPALSNTLRERVRAVADTRLLTLGEEIEAKTPPPWHRPAPEDIAFVQHSSGTTGLQKGVALSHAAVLNQLAHLADALELTGRDTIVSWLPFYHDMGLIACLVLPLAAHLHVVTESPTDWVLRPASLLQLATKYMATLSWLPNFAFQFLASRVSDEDVGSLNLSTMRAFINCSEPVRAHGMDAFAARYGASGVSPDMLQTSYAMAENTFAVTQSPLGQGRTPPRRWVDRDALQSDPTTLTLVETGHPGAVPLVSSGRCLAANRIRVADANGAEVPDGTVGEVQLRSDSLFTGYLHRPDLTELAFREGWYRTRDAGLRLNGEVYVLGRQDDVIIVGGKNIHPQDVEEIAFSHPAVSKGRSIALGIVNELGTQDLAVIAEASESVGPERKAGIEAEIKRAVLAEIGVAPRFVYMVPPRWLVKSTAGKPARAANREKLFREHPSLRILHDAGRKREEP